MEKRGNAGYTVVEILVAVLIVGLLIFICFPLSQKLIGSSHTPHCQENLRQLAIALNMYLSDHEQKMPGAADGELQVYLSPYLSKKEALLCPSDPSKHEKNRVSYQGNAGLNSQNTTSLRFHFSDVVFIKRSDIPLFCDLGDWHPLSETRKGKFFLYADGSVGNHPLRVSLAE